MIYIDTGAFIAKYIKSDQHHKKANKLWCDIETKKEKIITSNFVLDETFTLLGRQANYEFSVQIARAIYSSQILKILRPTDEVETAALNLFEKFADQKVSFTDCISFQLMKTHHIKRVFGFDRHFTLAGFQLIGF